MKRFIVYISSFSLVVILGLTSFVLPVRAVCPVCTVAVVAGLGISRTFGIDDVITSIWIGGLILSTSFWILDWIFKKGYLKKIRDSKVVTSINALLIVIMYLLVLVPLKLNHSIGIIENRLWGIDKIVLGIIIGSILFVLGVLIDKKIRKIKGKQLFMYQKVVFPVSFLFLGSLVFYLITR